MCAERELLGRIAHTGVLPLLNDGSGRSPFLSAFTFNCVQGVRGSHIDFFPSLVYGTDATPASHSKSDLREIPLM